MSKRNILVSFLVLTFLTLVPFNAKADTNKKEFPEKYDLREENRTSPVKTQGSIGSCWAISYLDSLESNMKSLLGEDYILSVNNMITQSSNLYNESYLRAPENGGDQAVATAYMASWKGPVLETSDPYPKSMKPKDIKLVTGLKPIKHIQEVVFLPERKDPLDNSLIKEMLMSYGGISASMWKGTPSTFGKYYNIDTFSWYYPLKKMNNEGNGHAVTIVGWDDNFSKDNFSITPKGDGAFIVKNTKGAAWGQPDREKNLGGYFYISYYDMMFGAEWDANVGMSVVTRIDEPDNYDNIYQYDPLGYTEKLTDSDLGNTVFFANVFSTSDSESSSEQLSAVSFYTLDENLDYEIYISTIFKNESSLDEMKLVQNGHISLPGYHTVDLNEIISLSNNKKIAVAIKLISKDLTPSIAVESPNGFMKSSAKSNTEESYILNSSDNWVDLYSIKDNSNMCIKIFTDTIENPNLERLTAAEMKADLDYIVDRITVYQPVVSKNGFSSKQTDIIADAYKKITQPLTKSEFHLVVLKIFTMLNDGHASIYNNFPTTYLDLYYTWINEGLIVNKTSGNYFLGDKILSIGGKTPDELCNMLYSVISSENDYWIRRSSNKILKSKYYMDHLDLINSDGTIDIVVLRDDKIITYRDQFKIAKNLNYNPNSMDNVFSWRIEEENNLGYFRLDSWVPSSNEMLVNEINENLDMFFKEVAEKNITNIALDLRYNNGGSTPTFNHLLKYIDCGNLYRENLYSKGTNKVSDDLLFKGNMYVMTSYESFSCSLFTTTILRGNGIATVIGEPTGEKPNFNIHGSKADGTLPSTGWNFMMSSHRPEKIKGFTNDETTLTPDILINRRAIDIVSNRDIHLEKLREITRDDPNCAYSYFSINSYKDSKWKIKYSKNTLLARVNHKKSTISLPFPLDELKSIYLIDPITRSSITIKHDKNEIVLPSDIDLKTYYLKFSKINSSKVYKILISVMPNEIYPSNSRTTDFYGSHGVWRKHFNISNSDFNFSTHDIYNYLLLDFNKELSPQYIESKISLSLNDKRIQVLRSPLASSNKEILLIVYPKDLAQGPGYKLVIPKNTIKFSDSTYYAKEITLDFLIPKMPVAFNFRDSGSSSSIKLEANKSIKKHNARNSTLVDSNGNIIEINSVSITGNYRHLTFQLDQNLIAGETYTLTIPADSVHLSNGVSNDEPLIYEFTAD